LYYSASRTRIGLEKFKDTKGVITYGSRKIEKQTVIRSNEKGQKYKFNGRKNTTQNTKD